MEKILENTYRNVNIALINEFAMLATRWDQYLEVVDAASTKPYGFQINFIRGRCGHVSLWIPST